MLRQLRKHRKPRQLVASSAYSIYTVLVVTNLILNRDSLSTADIVFLTTGFGLLASASAHSLGRSIYQFYAESTVLQGGDG